MTQYNGEKELVVGQSYTYADYTFDVTDKVGSIYTYILEGAGKTKTYKSDLWTIKKRIGYLSSSSSKEPVQEEVATIEVHEGPKAQQIDVAAAITALQTIIGGGKDEELRTSVEALKLRISALEMRPSTKLEICIEGAVKGVVSGLRHSAFDRVVKCAALPLSAKCLPYLYGPSGTGKTHTSKQVSEALGLRFFLIPSIQDILQLEGFVSPITGEYQRTSFREAYENGGLVLLDEIDGGIPDVLIKINAALGNGYYDFPDEQVVAHKDFRVIAAGNTCGKGANEKYTGRFVIDEATLNRFAVIPFGYDSVIEESLGSDSAVEIVRGLRYAVNTLNLPFDYGYRDIERITAMEAIFTPEEVVSMAVERGRTKDEMRNITRNIPASCSDNPLYKAMEEAYL